MSRYVVALVLFVVSCTPRAEEEPVVSEGSAEPVAAAPAAPVVDESLAAPRGETFSAMAHVEARVGMSPLRDAAPLNADAATFAQWQTQARERLRASFRAPAYSLEALPADIEVLGTETVDGEQGYTRSEVTYRIEPGLRTRAFLFTPTAPGPHPAVVFWHGHGDGGHRASAGIAPWDAEHNRHHAGAVALAEAGYVVLAPTIRSFGQDADPADHLHFESITRMRGTPAMGYFVEDALRALAIVRTVEGVDSDRVGVTGLSVGGLLTLLSAALDPDVSVAVVNGYLGSYRTTLLSIEHCPCQFAGALGSLYDLADIAAMIAPRSLEFVAGERDHVLDFGQQQRAFEQLRPAWTLLGAPDAVAFAAHPDGHEFIAEPTLRWFAEAWSAE